MSENKGVKRRLLLDQFIQATDEALSQLQTWRGFLATWKANEEMLLPLPDDLFMSLINDLKSAGLLEFVDGQELDALREALTGVDSSTLL